MFVNVFCSFLVSLAINIKYHIIGFNILKDIINF